MLYVAGIKFNDYMDISDYCDLYNKSIINTDLLGVWDGGMKQQSQTQFDYLNKDNRLGKKSICAHSLEPFYFMNDPNYKFNEIFKNKKILVISSHKNTIMKQLNDVNSIFKNKIFDETTTFYVYKPPQQNAGNNDNNNWEYHFNQLKNDIRNIKTNEFDFDIAFVSCGGFGMITSDFIFSELNSSAIYIGGALQLFFGIKGGRWSSNPDISCYFNENWTNVLDSDKPKNPKLCEGSAYW